MVVERFDKVVWTGTPASDSSLKLTYDAKDGEEGYPGNLHTEVVYTLTGNNELKNRIQGHYG